MPEEVAGLRLDRSIPIGVILALLVQTIAGVFWIGSLSATVEENTDKLNRIENVNTQKTRDDRQLYREIATLQAQMNRMVLDSAETRELVTAMHQSVREALSRSLNQ